MGRRALAHEHSEKKASKTEGRVGGCRFNGSPGGRGNTLHLFLFPLRKKHIFEHVNIGYQGIHRAALLLASPSNSTVRTMNYVKRGVVRVVVGSYDRWVINIFIRQGWILFTLSGLGFGPASFPQCGVCSSRVSTCSRFPPPL